MTKRLFIVTVFSASVFAQGPFTPRNSEDPWESLKFLIGTWEATTHGGTAGATGAGTYTFQFELGHHVLARHSKAAECKGPSDFDCEHGDLLYIYQGSPNQPLKAIYFDNEGHVIHYDVTSPSPGKVVLLSASSQPGPKFRLVYEFREGIMHGTFQLRAPGESDFRSYLEWSGGKK